MPRKAKAKREPDDQFAERVELRISADEKDLFSEAAKRYGLTLSQWLRLAARMVLVQQDGKIEFVEIE